MSSRAGIAGGGCVRPQQRYHRPAARLPGRAHVPEAQAAAYRPRPPPLWRVSDAIPHLRQRLAALPDGAPLAALLPPIDGADPGRALRCRAAVAGTLVAGLELARDGALALDQDAAWTDIRVSRRERHGLALSEPPA